jgi:hypothetical protein
MEAVGAQESDGEWGDGVTCEVVGEVVRRLGTSLTGGPRWSEWKKEKEKKTGEREREGRCGWAGSAGPIRSPGLGPVELPSPFFSLKLFLFISVFSKAFE